MCGRYALNTTAAGLIEHFQLLACPDFGPRYNIAPTSQIPVIRFKPDAGRVGQLVRWGLIPSRAEEPTSKLNNARGETVAGKKQPYYIHPTDADFFAFAGLLAAWKAPYGQTIVSTCIITTGPNEVMAPIHDRVPVILAPDQYDAWLDPGNQDIEALKAVLRPCSAEVISAYPVSPVINSGKVEGLACIKPIGTEDAP